MKKTVVFIDGFNLYYGVLRRTGGKWLDLVSLFADHVLKDQAEVSQVRYYTAPIIGRMNDDPAAATRQRTYWQALKKRHPDQLQIFEGRIHAGKRHQRLVNPIEADPSIKLVQVYGFDEKKTDVQIAVDMLRIAWLGTYEQLVLCSNDSDFEPALRVIRQDHPHLTLGLVAPVLTSGANRTSNLSAISNDLMQHCHWCKLLNPEHIKLAQLPDKIAGTAIRIPEKWKGTQAT